MRRFVPASSCWFVIALVMAIAGPGPVAALRSASDRVAAIAPGTPGLKARPPSSQASPAAVAVSFDMVVTDREGRVPDSLGPADLTVSVDGKARRVLSLRRVSRGPGATSDAAARQARGNGAGSFAAEPSRNILVVVDQGTLVRGNERAAITAGNAFLDRLGMADRVAVLHLPLARDQLVSLTTEQPVAREALTHVLGQVMPAAQARPDELAADRDRDRAIVVAPDRGGADVPVAAVPVRTADQEFDGEARRGSFPGLAGMLRALEAVPGRKVVALISAGVVAVSSPQLTDLAVAAVSAHTVIYAFGLTQPRGDVRGEPELGPVETLAKATGGSFTMLGKNPDRATNRVVADLATSCVVEIDSSSTDVDGKRHVLRVDLANRSLSGRAPAWLVPTPDAGDVLPAGPEPPAAAEDAKPARTPAASSAKDDELQVAMGRLIDYVEAYERQYSGLVAEEEYRQSARQKSVRLRSDFLLVKPENTDEWVSFRDVYDVDGVAVRDRDDRLKRLFLEPGVQVQTQLMAIKDESSRYNIGNVERNINVPLFPLRFLTPENRPRFRFKPAGQRQSAGVDVWRIEYDERARPTIITNRAERDMPAKGWFLVDQITGAIVESGMRVEEPGLVAEIIVTYRRDPALGMWVPAQMREAYSTARQSTLSGLPSMEPSIVGTASYSKFRRFQVKTEEKITIPK
jgi:VWFA-related protein